MEQDALRQCLVLTGAWISSLLRHCPAVLHTAVPGEGSWSRDGLFQGPGHPVCSQLLLQCFSLFAAPSEHVLKDTDTK